VRSDRTDSVCRRVFFAVQDDVGAESTDFGSPFAAVFPVQGGGGAELA